jgi:hypothetical protein
MEEANNMFLVVLDDGEGRLRDLILFFLSFFSLVSIFLRGFFYLYMRDCISLLLLDVIGGSNSSFCFVVFFLA